MSSNPKGLSRRRFGLAAAAAVAALVAGSGGARAADSLALVYSVQLGKLPVFIVEAEAGLAKRGYDMTAEVATQPMFRRLYDGTMTMSGAGSRKGARLTPKTYLFVSRYRDEEETVEIGYRAAGGGPVRRAPPRRSWETSLAGGKGAFDPMAAVIRLMAAIDTDGACPKELKIFDGFRKFTIAFDPGAETVMPTVKGAVAAMAVTECLFRLVEDSSGKQGKNDYLGYLGAGRVMVGRPIADGPPVPVFAEAGRGVSGVRLILMDASPSNGG